MTIENTLVAAPLPPDALERVIAPFGSSRTLPGEAYSSAEIFAWEQENFFEAAWVCLCREEEIARPGDYRAARLGRQGILLTRDDAGALHGFFNVCRHRGHELLAPGCAANARAIRCPYHAWVYELDGALKAATRFGEVAGFDPAEHALVPVRVESWQGWIFVNVSGDAPLLEKWLGGLSGLVAAHAPGRLRVAARHSYEIAANWKIISENYHECYHCPQIHPQLCRVTPPDSGRNSSLPGAWAGGFMDLVDGADTMSLDGKSHSSPLAGLRGESLREIYYYGLLPNLLISLHPDYVLTHRLEPRAADRTFIECQWLFPAEALAREGFSPDYAVEFWDVTNKQDWHACESVQRGVSSRGYRPGPLSARESAVYRFLTKVARGYLTGRVDPSAAPA
jgi:Rieske 2Fe-2S family protein